MQGIQMDELEVPDFRVRTSFDEDKIANLAESIRKNGLLHPIVLQDDGKTLLAGERRFRAVCRLFEEGHTNLTHNGTTFPSYTIPYTTVDNSTDDVLLEMELEENVVRDDLTWQERARATQRLHELRESQHGAYVPNHGGWATKDTATEVYGERNKTAKVSNDLVLAQHLDDPDVASAKDEKEARKVIEKKAKRKQWEEASQNAEKVESEHTLINDSAFNILPTLEPETFDVLCSDPPYGIDVHKKAQRDGEYHEYDDSPEYFYTAIELLAEEGYRVTKPQAHAYIFCDISYFYSIATIFDLQGWEVYSRPLIWYKGNTGSFGGAEYWPRRTYECVMYANKGQRPVTAMYHDVINIPKPSATNHPAGKPPEVYEDLLRRSVHPGSKVLDPFCGGGPIFPAASKLQATATGIELAEHYHGLAVSTLKEMNNDLSDLV